MIEIDRAKVKEYLNRARKLKNEQSALEQDKIALETTLTGAPDYSSDGSQHNPSGNTTEKNLVEIADIQNKIEMKSKEIFKVRVEIQSTILILDDPVYREVLTRFYLNYQTWAVISEEMHGNDRNFRKIRDKACDKIARQCPCLP